MNNEVSFFDQLTILYTEMTKQINAIKNFFASWGFEVEMPNTGITLNNKMIEILQVFKQHNVPFNAKFANGVLLTESYLEFAIIDELSKLSNNAVKNLEIMSDTIYAINNYESDDNLQKKVGRLFNKEKRMEYELKEQQFVTTLQETFTTALNTYLALNDAIYKYTLEDNLINSIANELEDAIFSEESIPAIKAELDNLGLDDLTNTLDRKLQK